MSRRALALVMIAALYSAQAAGARADDPVDTSTLPAFVFTKEPTPAPLSYAAVPWLNPNHTLAAGYWYSAAQVVKTSRRIDYLETKAAKECVDAQIAASKSDHMTLWKIAAGVAAGAAIGFCAGTSSHCGISK